jgi:GxxExxY protein
MAYQGLHFEREKEMPIFYRDDQIGARRVDFFVERLVMVELKAIAMIEDTHKAQATNYLEACNIADGLLINFGGLSLEVKRMYNKKIVKPDSSA